MKHKLLRKNRFLGLIFFVVVMVAAIMAFSATRRVTLTTYYPAPYGKYNDLQSKTLIVSGQVGIGTTSLLSPPATSNPLAASLTVNAPGDRWAGNFETGNGYGYGVRIYTKETHSNMAAFQIQSGTIPVTTFEVMQGGGAIFNRPVYFTGTPALIVNGSTGSSGPVATIKNLNGYGGGLQIETVAHPLWTGDAAFSVVNAYGGTTYNHFYIDKGSGNVGIGTTEPNMKLQVQGDGIKLNDGTTNARIQLSSGLFLITDSNHQLQLRTNNLARLVIDPTGNVGIGTEWPTSRLDVQGGCITGFICSDKSMKKNIWPLPKDDSYLEKILNLNGVSFEWKNQKDKKKYYGLIAQDVEKIIPEVVVNSSSSKGQMGLSCTGIDAVLVEAIKELKAKNENKIDALKQENITLKEELAGFKTDNLTLKQEITAIKQELSALLQAVAKLQGISDNLRTEGYHEQ